MATQPFQVTGFRDRRQGGRRAWLSRLTASTNVPRADARGSRRSRSPRPRTTARRSPVSAQSGPPAEGSRRRRGPRRPDLAGGRNERRQTHSPSRRRSIGTDGPAAVPQTAPVVPSGTRGRPVRARCTRHRRWSRAERRHRPGSQRSVATPARPARPGALGRGEVLDRRRPSRVASREASGRTTPAAARKRPGHRMVGCVNGRWRRRWRRR